MGWLGSLGLFRRWGSISCHSVLFRVYFLGWAILLLSIHNDPTAFDT